MGKNNSKNEIIRALTLLAALVVVFGMMSNMGKITETITIMLTPRQFDFEALEAANVQRQEYYDIVAGFWEHSSDTLFDRIELMDDGIIWQYTKKMFMMPNGQIDTLKRISTSFLYPVNFEEENNSAMSDLRMIREVWITPDTCFGRRTFMDYASTAFSADDDILFFNGVPYTRFEGDIREFFPVGALNLLRPNPITFAMPSCNMSAPLRNWLSRRIVNSFEGRQIPAAEISAERRNLLENYFIPLSLSRMESRFKAGQELNINLRIIVAPDGGVDTVFVRGQGFGSQASRLPITNEIMGWRFPVASDGQQSADTLRFIGTFIKR
ncbi:MAG: hypothetical protein FWE23_10125 [Chitinivibrionia bacterium]|nr:hypothetical protein [Chitinivibrionia bacterium]